MRPMTLRTLGVLALAAALFPAAAAEAAEVAVLKSSDAPAWRPALEAFRRAAAGHSLSEFDLKGVREEGEKVLSALKGRNVILVAMGALAAQLARELAPDLPMVYCMIQDPTKAGLVGLPNTAGVSFSIPAKNQLAAFRMVYPRGVRVGVLYTEDALGRQVQEAVKAASVVRLALVARAVASERDVPQALRSLLKGDEAVDAFWLLPDPVLLGEEARRHILSETFKAGRPVFSFSATLVPEGALVSNGPDFASIGQQAAELVNRLAAGERKLEMLIPRAELVINTKIADKLKIEIPADALRAASRTF